MKILVAEDDFLNRKYLVDILSQYGECDVAVDGMDAVDAFLLSVKEKNYYQLICLDIIMPKLDGIKILKAIKSLSRVEHIPLPKIIMCSSLSEVEYIDRVFEFGCDAYIKKPLDEEKVREVLQNLSLIK